MRLVTRHNRSVSLGMVAALIAVVLVRHFDKQICPKHNVVLYRDGLLSGRRYCPLKDCGHESTREYRQSLREEVMAG